MANALPHVAECDDSSALQLADRVAFRDGQRPDDGEANPAQGAYSCAVEEAARILGQKWTLQIVNVLLDFGQCRFCELQDALGGVNPSTLSTRLKMLEEQGIIERNQISSMPPHVVYRLSAMGLQLSGAIRELTQWSQAWLCACESAAPEPAAQAA